MLHADDVLPVALVVVQVVLTVIDRGVLQTLCGEHINGVAVYGRPNCAVNLLGRSQESQGLHHIVPQLCAACVLRHRRITVVCLSAKHLDFLLSDAQCHLQLLLLHSVHIQFRVLAFCAVDAVVLCRVFCRGCSLNTYIYILQIDVPSVREPQVDVCQEVGFLVVLSIHRVQTTSTYHKHDTLALCPKLGKVNALPVIAQHIVLLEQGGHLIQRCPVNDVVVHLLVIGQRTVIHPYDAHLYVCSGAFNRDTLWRVLDEVVTVTIDVSGATCAVYIELHQPAVGTTPDNKGYLLPLVAAILSAYANRLLRGVAFVIFHFFHGASVHHGFVCCNLEALRAVQTAYYAGILVGDIAHLQLHLYGLSACGGI